MNATPVIKLMNVPTYLVGSLNDNYLVPSSQRNLLTAPSTFSSSYIGHVPSHTRPMKVNRDSGWHAGVRGLLGADYEGTTYLCNAACTAYTSQVQIDMFLVTLKATM